MSVLDLAKFLDTKTGKNEELKVDIEELENKIKRNLQLQQTELIHLEEKYHHLMKTHILDMMEKRGEKHKQNETLRKKLADAYKKSTEVITQPEQKNVEKVVVTSDPAAESKELLNQPQHDIQILKELQQKKREMYDVLEKRSIVEKLKQSISSKPEAIIKQNQTRERLKERRSLTRQSLRHAKLDRSDDQSEHVKRMLDISRSLLNHEPPEFDEQQQTKEPFVSALKGNYLKTWPSFTSFASKDLSNIVPTYEKFNVEPQKQRVKFPLSKARHVHFQEPDDSLKTTHSSDILNEDSLNSSDEECSNLQDDGKQDAKEVTYKESLDIPKNRSYTVLPRLKKESNIKTEKDYNKQQATTSGIPKTSGKSTTEKFTKKKKLLLDFEDSKSLSKQAEKVNNYTREESILSEAITNKKINTYNDFIDDEPDRASYKKSNWNFNSDSDTSSEISTGDKRKLGFTCTKFFCHK